MSMWSTDWGAVLLPDAPILELVVRATVIYLFLYVLMRFAGRRMLGGFAMADILVVMLIAVAVREGISGGHRSVGDAIILATVVFAWDFLLDRLTYRSPRLRHLLRQRPVRIIDDGSLLVENARTHLLTRSEIMEKLRENGVARIDQVDKAWLEPDGSFSIITH